MRSAVSQMESGSFSPVLASRSMSPITSEPFSVIPWLDRVRNARTKRPIGERCTELTQLVHEGISTSAKDLLSAFTLICESCFDLRQLAPFESDSSWGLKTTTRNASPFDYDQLLAFFSTTGPLFRLMEAVTKESYCMCEFPIEKLPSCIRESLDQTIVPVFYANKYMPHSSVLHLKPLEYFCFSFFYYLQNESTNNHLAQEMGSSVSAVIVQIFESYLTHFVPVTTCDQKSLVTESSSPNSIWESLSSKTSNLLHLSSSPNRNSPTPQSQHRPSLINAKQFQISGNQFKFASGDESDSAISLKTNCRTFLSVFAEMMLPLSVSKPTQQRMSPLSMKTQAQPTTDQVRYVRTVIKHVHAFANSCPSTDAMRDPQFRFVATPLDELKRSVWTTDMHLQSRVCNFLKFCFETWPSDASFRMPVETWLSYIQPWRYKSTAGKDEEDDDRTSDHAIGKEWLPFITKNLPFYNSMFLQVVERLTRFDLTSSKNSVMLFRVMKVYASSRLSLLIREAEESAGDKNRVLRTPPSARSPFLQTRSPTSDTALIKHSFQDFEDLDTESVPLFSEKSLETIRELYTHILVAGGIVVQEMNEIKSASDQAKQSSGFIHFIKSLIDPEEEPLDDTGKNMSELKRTESQLNPSLTRMEAIFGCESFASLSEADQLDNQMRQRHFSTPVSAKKQSPDMVLSPDGTPVLSPAGRTQLLNRLAKSNISFEGNPDEQRTRSYEIEFLVKSLLHVSAFINSHTGSFVQRHYSSGSLVSKFLQLVLCPPTTYTKVEKDGPVGQVRRTVEQLPARVCLRRLADRRVLLLVSIFLAVAHMSGFSPLSIAGYSVIGVFSLSLMSFVSDQVKNW